MPKKKEDTTVNENVDLKVDPVTTEAAVEAETNEKPAKLAKAGKRSAKAVKEKEELVAKEARKTQKTEEAPKKKTVTRSKLERRSKKYKAAHALIDQTKSYSLAEAAELAVKTSTVKFDATVELHVNLNVDPKQADQNIRETLVLPEGTGKKVRVAVFADSDLAAKAKTAGADIAEADEFLARLEKNEVAFDILIATPQTMPKLGKYARLLGPKGLMPNPKSGTVTTDVEKSRKRSQSWTS